MAFIPNTTCLLYKNIGYNTFGEPKFGRGELTRCAIVKLIGADEKRLYEAILPLLKVML